MTITNELFLHGQKQADRTNEIIVYVDGCQFRRLDDTRFEVSVISGDSLGVELGRFGVY